MRDKFRHTVIQYYMFSNLESRFGRPRDNTFLFLMREDLGFIPITYVRGNETPEYCNYLIHSTTYIYFYFGS